MIPIQTLQQRLGLFTDAGLIDRIPTRWQRFQGMVEMMLYVLLPDARDGKRYHGTPLGHPLLRQPLSLWSVGPSHLRLGDGLGAPLEGLCRHLMFVHHEGFPVYDLQLIQTHPDGIAHMRRFVREVEEQTTARGRRIHRAAGLIVPDARAYRRLFLESGGYLDRAEALDYQLDPADESHGDVRPEFMTLVRFLDHCARTYPERWTDRPVWSLPGHLANLFTTRLRPSAP